jgi:hypothetical protein
MNIRPFRHIVFGLALGLFALGVVAALWTGVPSFLAVSTLMVAVTAWAYDWKVGAVVMVLGHLTGIATMNAISGPDGLPPVHPLTILAPIIGIEALVLLALTSLRRSELGQETTGVALRQKNAELEAALAEVKELRGMLPICAWCKSMRDVDGLWDQLESYLARHSHATFTHGICPPCLAKQTAEVALRAKQGERGPHLKTKTAIH